MDEVPAPGQLRTAARASSVLAYAAGLAGIAGGTLILREGEVAFAIILWVITFAVGASLMGVSLLIRALAGIAAQLARMESDLRVVSSDQARQVDLPQPRDGRDPWLGH